MAIGQPVIGPIAHNQGSKLVQEEDVGDDEVTAEQLSDAAMVASSVLADHLTKDPHKVGFHASWLPWKGSERSRVRVMQISVYDQLKSCLQCVNDSLLCPPQVQGQVDKVVEAIGALEIENTGFTLPGKEGNPLELTLVLDPLSKDAQQWAATLDFLRSTLQPSIRVWPCNHFLNEYIGMG